MTVEEIANHLNMWQRDDLIKNGYTNGAFFDDMGNLTESYTWVIREKRKYTYLDCGSTGYFMIENSTGEIFNIKAYGQIDKNKKQKADLGNIKDINTHADVAALFDRRYNYLR